MASEGSGRGRRAGWAPRTVSVKNAAGEAVERYQLDMDGALYRVRNTGQRIRVRDPKTLSKVLRILEKQEEASRHEP